MGDQEWKTGLQAAKRLSPGCKLPAAAWEETMVVQHNQQLRVEYLQPLQQYLLNNNRQTWLGEGA